MYGFRSSNLCAVDGVEPVNADSASFDALQLDNRNADRVGSHRRPGRERASSAFVRRAAALVRRPLGREMQPEQHYRVGERIQPREGSNVRGLQHNLGLDLFPHGPGLGNSVAHDSNGSEAHALGWVTLGGCHVSRKLRSRSWPVLVMIDSGWNCTPSTGRLLWRKPMITPLSDHAVTSSSSGMPSCITASEW